MAYYANILAGGEEMEVFTGVYTYNNRVAIHIMSGDGPFCHLSVNIEEVDLEPREFVVHHDLLHQSMDGYLQDFLKSGLFRDTGKRVSYGWCKDVPVWELTLLS